MKEFGECSHWYGVNFTGLDCSAWLPYLDAETIGEAPERKITIEYTSGDEEEGEGDRLGCADDDVTEAA